MQDLNQIPDAQETMSLASLMESDAPAPAPDTQITPTAGTAVTEEYRSAITLHQRIMANGEIALSALNEMCKSLKEMRDQRLYAALGYDSFDEYVEGMVGIKARQAYTYISTYETLGAKMLRDHAELGITKLSLIAAVPALDRADFVEDNNLSGMSTREIKELIEQNKQVGEQLSLLQEDLATTKESEQESTALLEQAREEADTLRARLKEIESRPTEVAVSEPTPEMLEKFRKEAERDAAQKQKEATEKAIQKERKAREKELIAIHAESGKKIAAAREEAAAAARAALESSLSAVEQEKAEALQKAASLEKQLQVSTNPDSILFNHLFEEMQGGFNRMMGIIAKMDEDTAAKFKGALRKALSMLLEKVGGGE